jgi:MoxR-like ATPase
MMESSTDTIQKILATLERTVIGQRAAAEELLTGYMAGGHVLLEGVPGIGKTLLATALGACLGLRVTRLQFTPDLMPTDVIGANVFDPASRTFRLVRGPVFTQILMADEVNRTPPKTQSALLEAMQERQVSIDGATHALDPDFFVIATQNPVEFEGTYPLPEAQLDRFLLRVAMGLPGEKAEIEICRRAATGELAGWQSGALPAPATTPEESRALRSASRSVYVAPELIEYLTRLSAAVRQAPQVELGISPRGTLSLMECARAAALASGRDFVVPDDLKRLLVPCWGHRMMLSAESELEGHTPRKVLETAAQSVRVPREIGARR